MTHKSLEKNLKLKIAVVTPVYNDAECLWRLYTGIEDSTDKDVCWIIINDGSTDNTEEIMRRIRQAASFPVKLMTKKNGGKCRALNSVFEKNNEFDFYLILDSDEMIKNDAIENIKSKVYQYYEEERVGSIYVWRNMVNDKKVSQCYQNRPDGDVLVTYYGKCTSGSFHQGGAIGYYKRLIDHYRFREFFGEKYLGESTLLLEAAQNHYADFTVLSDAVLSDGAYQEGGLSKQGRLLRIRNPYGMIYYSGLMASAPLRYIGLKVKYSIAVQAYAFLSDIGKKDLERVNIDRKYLKWWAYIPGLVLGIYWRARYL